MKKTIIAAAIAVGLGGTSAIADGHANSVSLQLQWVTQAQFAGYYVALDKGFYEAEGLDVTIFCLLYTSPSPRDRTRSRMPSSA